MEGLPAAQQLVARWRPQIARWRQNRKRRFHDRDEAFDDVKQVVTIGLDRDEGGKAETRHWRMESDPARLVQPIHGSVIGFQANRGLRRAGLSLWRSERAGRLRLETGGRRLEG